MRRADRRIGFAVLGGAGAAVLVLGVLLWPVPAPAPPAPARHAPPVAAAPKPQVPVPAEGRVLASPDRPLDLPGTPVPVRSLLDVPGRMSFGQSLWSEKGVPDGPLWVRVDRAAQLISVFRGPHEIGTAVILYGAPQKPTPAGRYPILARLKDHRSSLYDADMPYTLRLTDDGIAIHASNIREGRATHGCIGVPEDFAKRLFDMARKGDAVFIV